MSETDTTTSGDTTQTTATAQETPSPLVNHEGAFSEKWKDSLPEEIRGEKMLDNLGDFHGLMKQFVHAQKQIGKDKVVLPDEKSTENDWNVFYEKIGRPKTVGDYKFAKDENLPEDSYDDNIITKFLEGAHKVGITQKQIDYLSQFEAERIKGGLEALQEQQERDRNEAERAVKAKWGAAYDQMLHLANYIINENTEEGADRQALLERAGNDPVFADYMARLCKKYEAEDKAVMSQMKTPTPADAISQAEQLRATPGYTSGELYNSNPAKYNEITRKIQELYEIANA